MKIFIVFINLIPGKSWFWPLLFLIGFMVGLYSYLIYVSRAASYLSDDSTACVNCHIMTPHYKTWSYSSHKGVTNCNDCHVPHNNILNKYYFKAKDGLYHASVFTLRLEPQVILAKEASQEVIQDNCIRCHEDQIQDEKNAAWIPHSGANWEERHCWDCHRDLPHGRVNSLSSIPLNLEKLPVQDKESMNIPSWMQEHINK